MRFYLIFNCASLLNIVRIDERTKNLFFLAGEENIIEIYPNGKWRYIG
ncbi:DUF6888 family protein [Nostoc sp.]